MKNSLYCKINIIYPLTKNIMAPKDCIKNNKKFMSNVSNLSTLNYIPMTTKISMSQMKNIRAIPSTLITDTLKILMMIRVIVRKEFKLCMAGTRITVIIPTLMVVEIINSYGILVVKLLYF